MSSARSTFFRREPPITVQFTDSLEDASTVGSTALIKDRIDGIFGYLPRCLVEALFLSRDDAELPRRPETLSAALVQKTLAKGAPKEVPSWTAATVFAFTS